MSFNRRNPKCTIGIREIMLLGFDIGGTKCAIVIGQLVADDQMQVIDKLSIPTSLPAYEMIEFLFSRAEELLQRHQVELDNLTGIGISCGGPLNEKAGVVVAPPNLLGWIDIPLVEMTKARFGCKTMMINDANAGAVAEWRFGAGRGFNSLIFLTFGTGMGAGLILDGKLYSGVSGFAGEVGHLRLSDTGPVGFGKAGSFEGWCSGGGIAQLAQTKVREKLQVGEVVSFCDNLAELPRLTAAKVAEAAYAGDPLAIEIFQVSSTYLGKALALLIDVLNPEAIILGSIYGRSRSLIEPKMLEVVRREAYGASFDACSILPIGLGEHIGDVAALTVALMAGEADEVFV